MTTGFRYSCRYLRAGRPVPRAYPEGMSEYEVWVKVEEVVIDPEADVCVVKPDNSSWINSETLEETYFHWQDLVGVIPAPRVRQK
jgi:hypothetical protein